MKVVERTRDLRKPPENIAAYEQTLKALDLMTKLDKESYRRASKYLQKAIDLDPNSAMPLAYMVRWYCMFLGQGWSEHPQRDVAVARQIATKAIRLDRSNALALASYGQFKCDLERDYDSAILFLNRSRELGSNLSLAWMLSSVTLSYLGQADSALEHAKFGLRLSPNDPNLFQFYEFTAIAYYIMGDFKEAAHWSEASFAEQENYVSNWHIMILANAASGQIDRAQEFAEKVVRRNSEFSTDHYLKVICPFRRSKDRQMAARHLGMIATH